MATSTRKSKISLYHRELGPPLFQYRSEPFPVDVTKLQSQNGPPERDGCIRKSCGRSKKPVHVKCAERQDANTMFAKRLRERYKTPLTATSTGGRPKSTAEEECELYVKEKMFRSSFHKISSFPPPSFMPRWNPRHKNRTYANKLVLDDPWSLSPEDRAEIKKRTGLRLKSISRHYQFKVGTNLPFGKEALTVACTCHIDFCDHCQTSHTRRCPLHLQALDPVEPDCKTELTEFCPWARNPEDSPLDELTDVDLYVSEVVRRLRAGELKEAPPFPARLLHTSPVNAKPSNIVESESEAVLNRVRAEREDMWTQTEPFKLDLDQEGYNKADIAQTSKPDKAEPMMVKMVRCPEKLRLLKPFSIHEEKGTQVRPCLIDTFQNMSHQVVQDVSKMVVSQSLQEISDEVTLEDLIRLRAKDTETLAELQRRMYYRFMQEEFRASAYHVEREVVEAETAMENSAEDRVSAIIFAQSYLCGLGAKVMEKLRKQGYLQNADLQGIQTDFQISLNDKVEARLNSRAESYSLLDEIINHSLRDLEMDYFRRNLVDQKFLKPSILTSKHIREVIELRDNVIVLLEKMREDLFNFGYRYDFRGHLVPTWDSPSPTVSPSTSQNLDSFIDAVRISVDEEGVPQYLVDLEGRPLPIHPKWMGYLQSEMANEAKRPGTVPPPQSSASVTDMSEGGLALDGMTDEFDTEQGDPGEDLDFDETDWSEFLKGWNPEADADDGGLVVFRRGTGDNGGV